MDLEIEKTKENIITDQADPMYWESRKRPGRPRKLESPDVLWGHAVNYFELVDDNPIIKKELIRGGDRAGSTVDLEIMRPYTWEGFEGYLADLDIIAKLEDYKANYRGAFPEYADVVRRISQRLFDRNFGGAAANVLNASIIARQLQLVDRVSTENVTITAEVPVDKLSEETLNELAKYSDAGTPTD